MKVILNNIHSNEDLRIAKTASNMFTVLADLTSIRNQSGEENTEIPQMLKHAHTRSHALEALCGGILPESVTSLT